MALSMRLSRGGSKKRPYYRIVIADARAPRDGKFIEKIGTYNPLLAKESEDRIKLDGERASHWLKMGAQPTDRVARFLDAAGLRERVVRSNPNKGKPGEKATERAEERAEKAKAAEDARAEAEEAAKAKPVEAPVEEAAAEEAPADDVPAPEETVEATTDVVETATDEPTPEATQAAEATAEDAAPAEEGAPTEEAAADSATDDVTNDGESAKAPAEG